MSWIEVKRPAGVGDYVTCGCLNCYGDEIHPQRVNGVDSCGDLLVRRSRHVMGGRPYVRPREARVFVWGGPTRPGPPDPAIKVFPHPVLGEGTPVAAMRVGWWIFGATRLFRRRDGMSWREIISVDDEGQLDFAPPGLARRLEAAWQASC